MKLVIDTFLFQTSLFKGMFFLILRRSNLSVHNIVINGYCKIDIVYYAGEKAEVFVNMDAEAYADMS